MENKLIIETERQLRDVYTATFTQPVLEQLAAQFMADQQGIDLDARGVHVGAETHYNYDAGPKRKVSVRIRIAVETPIEDEQQPLEVEPGHDKA